MSDFMRYLRDGLADAEQQAEAVRMIEALQECHIAQKKRADGLQKIVDAAEVMAEVFSAPTADCPELIRVVFSPNLRAGMKLYAAPVQAMRQGLRGKRTTHGAVGTRLYAGLLGRTVWRSRNGALGIS